MEKDMLPIESDPAVIEREILKSIVKPKKTKEHKEVKKPEESLSKAIVKPTEPKGNRGTKGFTLSQQLIEEIRKKADKEDLPESRIVERALRKAWRL